MVMEKGTDWPRSPVSSSTRGAMEISMRDWAAAKKDPMKRKIATNAAAPPALAAGNEADFLAAAIYFHSSVRVLLSRRHQGAVGARPGSGRGAPASAGQHRRGAADSSAAP